MAVDFSSVRRLWSRWTTSRPSYRCSAFFFLRGVAAVYFIAFLSLAVQIQGLIGSDGLLPVAPHLAGAERHLGANAVTQLPTLCWLDDSDGFLDFLCYGGMTLAAALFAGLVPPVTAALSWAFYLSLTTAGRTFLGFQWENLLLEVGFLAIFAAPWTLRSRPRRDPDPPRIALFLVRWLLFRFMISSGAVKLLSGDPSWRDMTALSYHYWTTCIPNALAWYVDKLPLWFHKLSCLLMFVIELVVPFFIFGPRRLRCAAFAAFVLLQVIIQSTGNYGFFNLLTAVMCIPLLDDGAFPAAIRRRFEPSADRRGFAWPRIVTVPVAAFILLVSSVIFGGTLRAGIPWPEPVIALYRAAQPYRSVNGYGLFAVMTKTRREIVIEGSMDGREWRPYEFKYKPGNPSRAPPLVAPHMPRLDWQMWFAALGSYEGSPWLVNLMVRLLQDSGPAKDLLADNPFPDGPPAVVRAVIYDYRYTDLSERRQSGNWWKREFLGLYCPPIQLNNPQQQ